MAASVVNKIEYLVLLVAAFAMRSKVTEAQAYRYLSKYGALTLCDKLPRMVQEEGRCQEHQVAERL